MARSADTKRLNMHRNPDPHGRAQIIERQLNEIAHLITEQDTRDIVAATAAWNVSQLCELCHRAAMMPVHELIPAFVENGDLGYWSSCSLRPLTVHDFFDAIKSVAHPPMQEDSDDRPTDEEDAGFGRHGCTMIPAGSDEDFQPGDDYCGVISLD